MANLIFFDISLAQFNGRFYFRYLGHRGRHESVPPSFSLGGSGQDAAIDAIDQRELLSLIKAYNAEQISAEPIADILADVCYKSHLHTNDNSVGPSCLVVWKRKNGGGSHYAYDHNRREGTPGIPSNAVGMDVGAICRIVQSYIAPILFASLKELEADPNASPPTINKNEIQRLIDTLPKKPDGTLTRISHQE